MQLDILYQPILAIENSTCDLRVLTEMLSIAGFNILTLTSNETEKIAEQKPLLVLLCVDGYDDGYKICEHIHTQPQTHGVPIIVVSKSDETLDKVRAFDAGAVDYVTAPYQLEEVLSRVQTHIQLYYQRQLIAKMREAEQRNYERLNQMRDDLLHATTHDLKNPLSVIHSYSDMLLKLPDLVKNEQAREFIQEIQNSANLMVSMIEEILELARLESRVGLSRRLFHLPTFLRDELIQFQTQATDKSITLNQHIPEQDLFAELDDMKLKRVLANLIGNALKYTPTGGTVTVELIALSEERVQIVISDTGIGIPVNALPHIFEKFFRVDHEDHRKQPGTGLGLATVKAIVEQHNGMITVDSQVGQGTTFIITLPLYAG